MWGSSEVGWGDKKTNVLCLSHVEQSPDSAWSHSSSMSSVSCSVVQGCFQGALGYGTGQH